MAITLHSGTSTASLVDALADDLRAQWPTDPFAPLPIVVANRAVERWLRHELATRLGVLANVTFPLLRPALDAAVAASLGPRLEPPDDGRWWVALPPSPDAPTWDAHALRTKVLAAFRAHRGDQDFEPVSRYLYADADAPTAATHREVALSGEVAAVIERLARERFEDALAWARDPSTGTGVAWLRRLCAELDLAAEGSPARQRERLLRGEGRTLVGPPLRVFGVTALAPADRRVLIALSRHLDVRWYRPTPVSRGMGSGPFTTPLLAGLGRAEQAERDAIAAVGLMASPVPAPTEPEPTNTLLARLQAWVRTDAAEPTDAPWPRDPSLTFHRAYGPQRQVEVLLDLLLVAFAGNSDLEPRDVLVLTPDLVTYAPLVAATFAHRGTSAPAIPVHIADLGIDRTNPLADVVLKVLELAEERVTAPRLHDLIATDPVRRRFGLDPDDVADLRTLIDESAMRWGLDAADREAVDQPALAQNTIEFGLERLAFGALMPDDRVEDGLKSAVAGDCPVVPFPLDAPERRRRVGLLTEIIRAVAAVRRRLAGADTGLTPTDWLKELTTLLDDFTQLPATQLWLRRQLDDALKEALPDGANAIPIGLRAMSRFLGGRFAVAQSGDRVITGAVTLSDLRPGRSLPYQVIALLGMDDGAFPRAVAPRAWDPFGVLRGGEIDPRDQDRLVLLETLMAAQERCIVLWSGFDLKKGAELPACVPVEELLGVIARLSGTAPDAIPVKHPLQPWSPEAFRGDAVTYDAGMAAAASALAGANDSESAPVLVGLAASREVELPEEDNPPHDLTLDQLAGDLANPAKLFIYGRLGVYLANEVEPLQDREPLELGHLDRWKVADEARRLLRSDAGAATGEGLTQRFQGRGVLPLEAGGAALAEAIAAEASAIRALYDALPGVTVEREAIAVDLTCGISLSGRPDRVREVEGGLVLDWIEAGAPTTTKRQLRVWLTTLAATAAGWPVLAGHMIGKHESQLVLRPPPPDEARRLLEDLAGVWQLGRRTPLRLFDKTSTALASRYPDAPPPPEDAAATRTKLANAIRTPWFGTDNSRGDLDDRWISALFGDYDPTRDLNDVAAPLPDGLLDLALRIWRPLSRHTLKGKDAASLLQGAKS